MAGLCKKSDRGNYLVQFNAPDGHRRSIKAGEYLTPAKAMATKIEALIAHRRAGSPLTPDLVRWVNDLDPATRDRLAKYRVIDEDTASHATPIGEHIRAYLEHCRHRGQCDRHLFMKTSRFDDLIRHTKVARLCDLSVNAVDDYLQALRSKGRSARTVNQARAMIVAFANWCERTGRIQSHRLCSIPKLDESQDRRRVRRPLNEEELAWFLTWAGDRDAKRDRRITARYPVYVTALLTGLRRSELRTLQWGDIDLPNGRIRIRAVASKAKREDLIPLHPDLARLFVKIRPNWANGITPVFKSLPSISTIYKDFDRARNAWVEQGTTTEERERRLSSDFLAKTDSEGRVIDLHAFRTTLGTQLALAGVIPQLAQKIMRHADYRTTQKHYTILGLADTTAAMNKLKPLPPSNVEDPCEARHIA